MRRLLLLPFVFLSILPVAAQEAAAEHHMIAAANPHAARAGLGMLRAGGSAVDAAIAAQAVLSLVEPQSSGLGGGGFLMHYDAGDASIVAYDGRETAPAGIDETLFLDEVGQPLPFQRAAFGGRAVGTPGVLAMLEMAHKAHGKLAWKDLFAPAISLAEEGFAISPRLFFLLDQRARLFREAGLKIADIGRAGPYFFVDGADGLAAKPVGTLLRNPAYAATLKQIAKNGATAFYSGEIARDIVATVRDNPFSRGALTLDDLAAYRPQAGTPVCGPYRVYRVCAMGPPSSGATTLLAILGILEGFDMSAHAPESVMAVHLFTEASRLAFADRNLFTGDAAYVDVPVEGLIDRGYLAGRRKLISLDHAMGAMPPAGSPPGAATGLAPGTDSEGPSTSHLAVIDSAGNMVSFTTTVQITFGSFLMSGGFLLNNQLTDFSFRPEIDGKKVANRPEPGKKPRSSMTPTLVFDGEGRPKMAIGSPGGSRIIDFVARTVVAVLDQGLTIDRAIALPNMTGVSEETELEHNTLLAGLADDLAAMGHKVSVRSLNSGLHGITLDYLGDGRVVYRGGADPRREGVAIGD